MNNFARFLTLTILLVPIPCFGSSSVVGTDIANMRQIAQAILLHAAENDDRVSIPFSEIPSVRRISEEMGSGTLAFASHEDYIFPAPDGDITPEIVPVAFFRRDDRVIIAFSDFTTSFYRLSDPPTGYRRSTWGWNHMRDWLLLSVSPLLNIVLLIVIVLMWRPRMK